MKMFKIKKKSAGPESPASIDIVSESPKQADAKVAEKDTTLAKHSLDEDDDDDDSYSSQETMTSIFSTKKLASTIGKITGKIAAKINSRSYDALEDSHHDDEKTDTPVGQPDIKEEISGAAKQTNTVEVTATAEKEDVTSRWRSAVDPLTGRTYYYHKDTKETVWEKPTNM